MDKQITVTTEVPDYRWVINRDGHKFRVRRIEDGTHSGENWLVFNQYGQEISIFSQVGADVINAARTTMKETEANEP
jgi:hypothetical protein